MWEVLQSVIPFLSQTAEFFGVSPSSLISSVLTAVFLVFGVTTWKAGRFAAAKSWQATRWTASKAFSRRPLSDICQEMLNSLENPVTYSSGKLLCEGGEFTITGTESCRLCLRCLEKVECEGEQMFDLLDTREQNLVERKVRSVIEALSKKERVYKRQLAATKIVKSRMML